MKTRSVFDRIFPPPKFLQMPFVGIDVSDDAVRIAGLKETAHGLEVDVYGERALSPGAIDLGDIKKPDVVSKALAELAQEHNISFARVSIPEEKAYIVHLDLPKMAPKEIRGNLELQFEEQVPIPLSEAVFDYKVVSVKGDIMHVMLSALPREIADKYLEVFKDTSIMPLALEVEAEAVSRITIPKGDMGTFLVVDIQFGKTSTYVVSGGAIRMTSSLAMGGDQLVKAAMGALQFGQAEAIAKLKKDGIPPAESELFNALVPALSSLRDELNKRYLFWNTHENESGIKFPKVEQIILCGEYAVVPGLTDYLAMGLRADTAMADILHCINPDDRYVPELYYEDLFRYGTAIGLALPRTC